MGEENLKKVISATCETEDIDFKSSFDTDSKKDWVELIKDFVALANSGGGVILFGVDNNGNPLGIDVSHILNIDPANITNKIFSYTSKHFSALEILEITKGSHRLTAIQIGSVKIPLVFTKPGTYPVSDRKQDRAFSLGTIYFRHGAKSEPANPDDIQKVIDRRLSEIRSEWMSSVQRVIEAPEGSRLVILPPDVRQSTSPDAIPIRIVDDPMAPEYRITDPNSTHPLRQKNLLAVLHERFPDILFNSYDILSVRRVYNIDNQVNYFYKPMYGSPQYSIDFVNWLIDNLFEDPEFFVKARQEYKIMR